MKMKKDVAIKAKSLLTLGFSSGDNMCVAEYKYQKPYTITNGLAKNAANTLPTTIKPPM